MRITPVSVSFVLLAVLAAGCSDSSSGGARACNETVPCPEGMACVEGVCTTPTGGGSTLVIGNDGGGVVTTSGGTTLDFGSGSLGAGTTVTITPIDVDTVSSAGTTLPVAGGFQVTITDAATTPPTVTIPNTQDLPADSQLLVVHVTELVDGSTGIELVGTASVSADGETIVSNNGTDASLFLGEYGVTESGQYLVVVTEGDQGFAVGQVTDASGSPLGGLNVFSSSGTFVGTTDDQGYFAVAETIGSTTLYVTDPETGAYGNVYVAVGDTAQVADITLTTPTSVLANLDNGCFETGALASYLVTGNTAIVASLGELVPPQGAGMVLMTTGTGSEGETTSGMDLSFTVPAGATNLMFQYKFLSNEYPDYVGSQYNDLFDIILYTPGGSTLAVEERVNTSNLTAHTNGYGGEIPWQQVSIDVSSLAGTDQPLTLSFMVSDVGDTVVDSAALIDDLHFDSAACSSGVAPTNDADGDTYPPGTATGEDCNDADATVYPGAPELCDSKDNNCDSQVDENCVTQLPQSHHIDLSAAAGYVGSAGYAIYQRFDATYPLDLDNVTLTFVPNSAHTSYTVTASALQWDSNLGALVTANPSDISNCDDCYSTATIPFTFNFYGVDYTSLYPGSNGYLTFLAGDSTYTESVEYFLSGNPRVSAFFDDLDTRSTTLADEVYFYGDTSKVVVTYSAIQHYSNTGTSNTFQFVLLADGTIRISYRGLQDLTTGCIAGITPGGITTTTP